MKCDVWEKSSAKKNVLKTDSYHQKAKINFESCFVCGKLNAYANNIFEMKNKRRKARPIIQDKKK